MKRTILLAVAASGLIVLSAGAQTNDYLNRFGVSYRPGFNISAKFTGLGGFPLQSAPGPATGSPLNRTYDDGFNRVDSSGNAGGLTWNWGYSGTPGQVPGNDTLVMHSSFAAPNASSETRSDGPQNGFEITYDRQLGTWGKCRWGLEAAFNMTFLDITDSQSAPGAAMRISDAYALGGITVPSAPYAGGFSDFGPMIGDTPSRSIAVVPGGVASLGQRSIDAKLYGGRLGPYLEIPLDNWCSFTVSGGLAFGWLDSDFSYSEMTTVPGAATLPHGGSNSKGEMLWGGYVGGTFSVALCERANVFAGAQYQYLGTFTQSVGPVQAELDLRKSVFVTVGLSVGF